MKAVPTLAVLIVGCIALAHARPSHGEGDDADLATKLSNPVASLISVPFQFNWAWGL